LKANLPMKDKLTYDQLTELIAGELELSNRFTRKFIKQLVRVIRQGLVEDGKVNLSNLGIFETKEVEAREGRDPKTGEPITIPAHKKVVFKPYKKVRERINQPYIELEAEFVDSTETEAEPESEQQTETTAPSPSSFSPSGESTTENTSSSSKRSIRSESAKRLQSPGSPGFEWLKQHKSLIIRIAGLTTLIAAVGYSGYKWLKEE